MMRDDFGAEISLRDAERYYRLLVEDILLDLAWFVDDETIEIIIEKLGCEPGDMKRLLPSDHPESAGGALRNLISGRTRSPRAFRELQKVCRNVHFSGLLAAGEGSPELYDALFGDVTFDGVGRARKGIFFTKARAARHLDLADEVLKVVLYGIVAAGHELVACAGEEFVVQVREEQASEETIDAVRAVAENAAGGLMKYFCPPCVVSRQPVW